MENMIRETLKGLEIALEERVKKGQELKEKDDTVLVEEKRAELQKEMDEKLNAFILEIETEKEKAIAKIERDVETINELVEEYNAKLAEIEAEKVAVDEIEKTETVSEDGQVEETKETIPEVVEEVVNPFRP